MTIIIQLKKGWNLIASYSNLELTSIIEKLGVDNLLVIKDETGVVYTKENENSENSFERFENNKAYWIKVSVDSELQFVFVGD